LAYIEIAYLCIVSLILARILFMASSSSTSSDCPIWTSPSGDLGSTEPVGSWSDYSCESAKSASIKIESLAKQAFLSSSTGTDTKEKAPELERDGADRFDSGLRKRAYSGRAKKAKTPSDQPIPSLETTVQGRQKNPYLARGSDPRSSDISDDGGCMGLARNYQCVPL
jgi:hypothetical protein